MMPVPARRTGHWPLPAAPAILLTALFLPRFVPAQAPPPVTPLPADRKAGADTIKPEDCKEWLSVLASDEFEGRGTGTEGFRKAAEFVAARFKEFGLRPVGDNGGYFQKVPFESTGADPARTWLKLRSGDQDLLTIAAGNGLGGRINEKVDADKPFAVLLADQEDDVDAAAIKDKAVLVIDRSKAARFGTPVQMRLLRAPPAVLLVIDDKQAAVPVDRGARIRFTGPGANVGNADFRQPNRYSLTRAQAQALVVAAGLPAEVLDRKEPGLVEAPGKTLQAHVETVTKEAFACNVLGYLEGSDPTRRQELVGIGSHLDHIGMQGGRVNNGADDDGSGTTGVLAVARAFSQNQKKPARSLLFMCFCGEELGLIGSAWYADHPVFPNDKMVAEIQMDMIGRNEEGAQDPQPELNENHLKLVGTKKLSDALHDLCLSVNKEHVGFDFEYDAEDVFYRSDHVNFARKDIPIAFLFTGFHPQYHHPDDDVERINFPKLARVAKLAYALAFELGDRAERPKVDRSFAQAQGERPQGRRAGGRRAGAQSRPQSGPASRPGRNG